MSNDITLTCFLDGSNFRLKRPGMHDLELCTFFGEGICHKTDVCKEVKEHEKLNTIICPIQKV